MELVDEELIVNNDHGDDHAWWSSWPWSWSKDDSDLDYEDYHSCEPIVAPVAMHQQQSLNVLEPGGKHF